MSGLVELQISGLMIGIDQEGCIGSGNCTKVGPAVFKLNDEDVVAFSEPVGEISRQQLIEACEVCPVNALYVVDEKGTQVVPK